MDLQRGRARSPNGHLHCPSASKHRVDVPAVVGARPGRRQARIRSPSTEGGRGAGPAGPHAPQCNPFPNIPQPWTQSIGMTVMCHHLPMIVSRIASVNVHSSRCAASPSTCAAPKGVRWGDLWGLWDVFCFSHMGCGGGSRTSYGSIKPSAATALNLNRGNDMPQWS